MGYFNIDYSQFAPSSKKVTPTPKPVTPTIPKPQPSAPLMTPRPTAPNMSPAPRQVLQNTQPTPTPQNMSVNTNPHGQYFSGNTLNKVFDTLLTPYYGFSGFLQGNRRKAEELGQSAKAEGKTGFQKYGAGGVIDVLKSGVSNIIPAIKNRTQFSTEPGDYNAAANFGIKGKVPQEVANFGLSLTAPNLPVGKILSTGSKILSKIPGVATIANKASQFAKTTPSIYEKVELISPYFRNPEVGKMIQNMEKGTAKRLSQLYNTLKAGAAKLNPEEQAIVGKMIEGVEPITGKLGEVAKPIIQLSQKLGQEAVDAGLLRPETFEKFKGRYMSHIWNAAASEGGFFSTVKKIAPKISGQFFKQREGAEGYIQEFAPAVFKGLGTEIKDIGAANLYRTIAERFGQVIGKGKPAAEGLVYAGQAIQNQKVARFFKNIALPQEIVEYINRTVDVPKATNIVDKAVDAIYKYWKPAKTIWNPGYHVRNLVSNQILSDMSTGEGLARTASNYIEAVKQFTGKGDQKFVTAAREAGLVDKLNFFQTFDELLRGAGLKKGKNILQKTGEKAQAVQAFTEDTAKLNVFTSWVKRLAGEMGTSIDDALRNPEIIEQAVNKAEEAIFSPYRISAAERTLVGKLIPFYSFSRQALPFFAKTAAEHPERITKYQKLKTSVEGLSSDEGLTQENVPEYTKNMIRTPIKDEQGRYVYVDPTYVYPFGNFQEAGFSKGQLPFGLSFNPLLSEGYAQSSGYDPYFESEFVTSNIPEERVKQRVSHAARTFAPTFVNNLTSKIFPAFKGDVDYAGRARGQFQAIVDALGLKTFKISPQELRSRSQSEQRTNLRSFQDEARRIQLDRNMTPQQKAEKLQRLREVFSDR